jgi:fructokinase
MDIVCLGEVLVDMFPAELGRRLVEVSAFRPKPGGAPANVAVAAVRLGAQAAFVGTSARWATNRSATTWPIS